MLSDDVIEKILSKLALTYGVRFNDLYAGMDGAMVRRNWQKELGDVSREGIDYAFANLPEKFPPNVLEFRRLCYSRRTEASRLALPPPKPARMGADEAERMRAAIAPLRRINSDPKAWALALRARELACERLTNAQRAAWRAALHETTPPDDEATA